MFTIRKFENCKLVRFVPRGNHIVIQNVYEVAEAPLKESKGRYMGIDYGISNLAAVASNVQKAFIVDGKWLSHINHHFNKRSARLKSKLPEGVRTSKALGTLTDKRNRTVRNFIGRASNLIINQAVSNDIDTIVIGRNIGWKQEVSIGKRNNQKFSYIPHTLLTKQLEYKARLHGITVIEQEESYTSKSSFFDDDPLPTYGGNADGVAFSGNRRYRGLYVRKDGSALNADINGALNIIRKHLMGCNRERSLDRERMWGLVVDPSRALAHSGAVSGTPVPTDGGESVKVQVVEIL